MSRSDSKQTVRGTPRALIAVLALLGLASFGGCFVSFDGYQLAESNAGMGGLNPATQAGATSGDRAGGATAGGATAGNPVHGGAGQSHAGSPGSGDSAEAGSDERGGSAVGGSAGTGGAGASASAGAPAAGSGGSAIAGAATGGGSGAPNHASCPDPHGRLTVEVPLADGSFYCIDRAEVKNAEYQAFMDAASPPTSQSAACAFNTSYQPATGNGCNQFDPVNLKNQPVACVDWCDAAAFCKWDGKRLCGKIGGGSNAQASFADASQSQWYRACSHAGDNELPYGNVYDGMKCVGVENTAIHPVAVPNTNCEGGYSGLYDMSGNVAEWEDSCAADSGASDQCLSRGGSYLDTNRPVAGEPSLLCNSSEHGKAPLMASKARSTRDKEIGFRCCSEPMSAF